jgi:putative ABC transport system substrate-binding protein
VAEGLVVSLARPATSRASPFLTADLNPKRFELLSELVPQAKVISLLVNPTNPTTKGVVRAVQEAARAD